MLTSESISDMSVQTVYMGPVLNGSSVNEVEQVEDAVFKQGSVGCGQTTETVVME